MLVKPVRGSEITKFNFGMIESEEEVVGLDISMNDLIFSQLVKTHEHRDCVFFNLV